MEDTVQIPRLGALGGASLLGLVLAGCGSGGGSGGGGAQSGIVGTETVKPGGGGTFFVDPNQSGQASRPLLVEMFWGRLVDVHDIDATTGQASDTPVFRDFVVNENVRTDVTNYVLETNPITQRVRLVIQRTKGAPDLGTGTFDDLLALATESMPPVAPFGDRDALISNANQDPDLVARNSTLVLRFNDLLDDGMQAEDRLSQTVKVATSYPPSTPFSPRFQFDRNYGGVAGGAFHSTRLLIDMTVSEEEAANSGTSAPINNLGLPASLVGNDAPNVSVRIPTRLDPASGQMFLFRNLSGSAMSSSEKNGPIDRTVTTVDMVRGMRSGRADDENNGFLSDLNPPQILGRWPVTVNSASPDPSGVASFDFVLTTTFTTPCRARMEPGDILSIGDLFLEVRQLSGDPTPSGDLVNLRIRVLGERPITNPNELLGVGLFQSTFDPLVTVGSGCWMSFTPAPLTYPATDLSPISVVEVSFTEPMDPARVVPFDTFSVIRGAIDVEPSALNTVVGEIVPSPDLRRFTFDPVLDLAHQQTGDQYHVRLTGVTDLAGNALQDALPFVLFNINPATPAVSNGGIVLRFSSVNEIPDPVNFNDLRGQFFYDFSAGVIRPRPVSFVSAAVDRTNPLPGSMVAITTGLQTPLVPLGSKMQTVWRYADFGWEVSDETRFNLDVIGLKWSPIGGQVLGDFYENFEMRLAHSFRLPDEETDEFLLPQNPNSGLAAPGGQYNANILGGATAQKVVHPRSFGYQVSPSDLTINGNGTFLMPYPLNRDLPPEERMTYTWRDTANLSLAAPNGKGIPMGREATLGIVGTNAAGTVAPTGNVPTIGLPLLIEIRTFPSSESVGLNALDVSIAINSSNRPFFRNYSSGGFNQMGNPVMKNPDAETTPTGGFNPTSTPPGMTLTGSDPVFYIGELDYVTRISRVVTTWIDSGVAAPDYEDPVFEPIASMQPTGTDLRIDFRAATGFSVVAGSAPFDATRLNLYGNPRLLDGGAAAINFLNANGTWFGDVDQVDGGRYLQMRVTFTSNIVTGLVPELSGIGVAYSF